MLPLSGVVGQLVFYVPTIHCCRCHIHCLHMLPPAVEHQCQLTPELGEAFGVRGRKTLSPGNHSEVGVSKVMGKLVFQCLVHLTDEFMLVIYNFSHQHLQLICKHILGVLGLLRPIIEICYQGTDSLAGLKCEAEIIYQSLKGMFTFGG